MSRLYDRVRANGCRPATRHDFATINNTSRYIPLEERLTSLNATLTNAGLDTVTLDEWRRRRQKQSGQDRLVVSDWRLEPQHLADVQVIAADQVAAYLHGLWRDNGPIDFSAQLGQIAPPFQRFWIESHAANVHGLHSSAMLFTIADPPDIITRVPGPSPDQDRWWMHARLILEQHKGDPFGPVTDIWIAVDHDGHLITDDDGLPRMPMRPAAPALLEPDGEDGEYSDVAMWNEELKFYLYASLLTISFIHCKNVDQVDHEPPEALSRKHQRRHGIPLVRYSTLDIEPMRRTLSRDGHVESRGLPTAMHICRGHFKTFTPDAPLFGKLTGSYWWSDHVRGDEQRGRIGHDYRIRIDDGQLGRPYEPADETPPASPRQRGADPDLSGRGRAAHATIQNALADAVRAAGMEPRSPRPEEPQYDLAWVSSDALWLCEVKSLTSYNELSQMHKAIGQIIDYAHRIEADLPVRMMIAVESQPSADHWVEECASQGIVLVWPTGFTEVLTPHP